MIDQDNTIKDEIIDKLFDAEEAIIDAYHLTKDRQLRTLFKIEMQQLETLVYFVDRP